MLIWQIFQTDFYIVLIFQTEFQDIELQDTYHTHNNLFHTGIVLLENLYRTFLRNLGNTFDELFSFHGIQLTHSCKMLRCESRDSFKRKFFLCGGQGISNRKNTRIKYTDNISGIRFLHDLTLLCHQLLRLGKFQLLIPLYMENFHARLELSGTDTHECDSVSVCLVHIRLDFKHKCTEILRERIDLTFI